MEVNWHLIPDGIETIVQFELKGEFNVRTNEARQEAETGIVQIISRLTGQDETTIRAEMEQNRWLGTGWRPEE